MARSGAGDACRRQVFAALERLGDTIVARHAGQRPPMDLDTFEDFSDHLTIIRTAGRYADYRIEFLGSVVAEHTPRADINKLRFSDLFDEPFYRSCLLGYRHVHLTGLPHVTRDHPLPGGRYFSRLLIPIFSRNQVDLLLGAAFFHDAPFGPTDRGERTSL